jgi:hypothetical protein
MARKKRYELPEEVLAVLECSPNLEPCKEFYDADIFRFADHFERREVPAVHCFFRADGQGIEND